MSESNLILLVEDNEANALLASTVLELEGFQVAVATSSLEARERLRDLAPALILMDLQLPGEDGLSLTRTLKLEMSTSTIPVIALTAHAMAGDRERVLAAGCEGYLSKPIDTKTFGKQVRDFLTSPRTGLEKEGVAH